MLGTSENILNKEKNDEETLDFSLALTEKLDNLPFQPGVYQFYNKNGKIIYVGKAKNLRNRVRSYFYEKKPQDAKTKVMISKINDVEVIVTDSEAEAFILEDTLIKKYQPRYNVLLRDDKSYPYVRITNEPFPRIFLTRNIVKDGSKYFGPYTEVRHLKQLLKMLRTIFQFRSCDYNLNDETISKKKYKLCLDFHIKKCEGPCEGLISKEKYNENIQMAFQVLNGKTAELEKKLLQEMEILASKMLFEEAVLVRNRYKLLKDYTNNQKIIATEAIDRDIFGLARVDDMACSLVFKVREGKLIGKRHYIVNRADEQSDETIMQRTIERWYLENDFIPKEIILPIEPEQKEELLNWLRQKREKSLEIIIPKLGDKRKLVALASSNAEYLLREYLIAISKREQSVPRVVVSLQRDLRLPRPPIRIECFDNSHIQGSEIVSSMIVFLEGKPKKSEYRKYKIKTVEQNDDFSAMREVVYRRYKRLLDENSKLPDLIVIDGGKGQLSSAIESLTQLNLNDKIPVISIAKRIDEIFIPEKSESIQLPKTSSSLRLIQQIRDEAHRFAITYHRQLRDKRTLQTELTEIKGIGEKIAHKLLVAFGSVENILKADIKEIEKVVGKKKTQLIALHFKKIS